MAEVLSPTPPPTSSDPISSPPPAAPSPEASTDNLTSVPRRPAPRERLPSSHTSNRLSAFSNRTSRSRPGSAATNVPAFHSSLAYTLVRDFAWPSFHPLHYGAPEGGLSGATTPGSEWAGGSRRLSDPLDLSQGGGWSAGPWGGAGVLDGDPDASGESLPSTSFGADDDGSPGDSGGKRTHRKSKSYASISDYERGRRRESAGYRRSRASGPGDDMFMFSGQQSDPAGRDSLRLSRGYSGPQHTRLTDDSGRSRADSHFQTMLRRPSPNAAAQRSSEAEENDFPLSTIPPNSPPHSPQRQSIGPEDEELYAGRSLALYPFEPENSNELRLREGQVILVAYRHGQGWLVAEDPETGEQGLVPEEYVRLLSELPHYDEKTGQFLDPDEVDGQEEGQTESSMDVGGDEEGGVTLGEVTSGKQEPRVDEGYQAIAPGPEVGKEDGVQDEKRAANR